MTKEEAIDIIRDTYHTKTELEALKVLIPELKDSEDERIRKELIGLISCMHDADPRKKRWIAWLENRFKSLCPQPKQEWSEEDKETIDLTIAVLRENIPNSYFKTNPANTLNMGAISTDELINRLKSLLPQPKQEWSEEIGKTNKL